MSLKQLVEAELSAEYPIKIKFTQPLPKGEPYDGERVWKTGDWYASMRGKPFTRCIIFLDCKNSAFPDFYDRKGRWRQTSPILRNVLAEYMQECRNQRDYQRLVIDGHLYSRDGAWGYIDKKGEWPAKNCLYIDDLVSRDVWRAGEGTKPYSFRRKKISKFVFAVDSKSFPIVRATAQFKIESRRQFERLRIDAAAALEPAGLLLRRDVPYEAGRTDSILTVPPL